MLQVSYQAKNLPAERKAILMNNLSEFAKVAKSLSKEEYFKEFHRVQAPLYWRNPKIDGKEYWKDIHINTEIVNRFIPNVYSDDYTPGNFEENTVPILVINGKHDFAMPHIAWDEYEQKLPKCTIKIYENSAHYPMVEEKEKFEQDIVRWINDLNKV